MQLSRLVHPRDSRTPVLVALMLAMALIAMDTTIVATAIPQVVSDLGGFALVGWVFSIYLLAQTVTIPIYGKFADIYGRKPILVIGSVIFLVGSVLSAFSWNMLALILFRALQGFGAGAIGATVNTLAGDLYDIRERGRIQGYLSSVWGISAVVAPTLGGIFAQYTSWRWIFLVNIPIGAIALTFIVRRVHEDVEHHRHRIDWVGAVLLFLAAGLGMFGVLQGGTSWPWWSVPSVVIFVAAGLSGVAAVRVERRAAEPIMPMWLWTKRITAGSYVATILAGLAVIGLSTFLPTWAQAVGGLTPVAAGFVLGTMSMSWPIASGLSSRLYLRIGFRDTAIVGAGFAIASGVVFVQVRQDSTIWLAVLGSVLMGAGMGLITTPLIVGLQSMVTWSQRGVITGGAMFSRFLGQSLGAAVFGAITNLVLLRHLETTPADLRGIVPSSVDEVSRALLGHPSPAAQEFMRSALQASTHAVFLGLLAAGVASLLVLLVVPRHFPTVEEAPSEASAAGGTTTPQAATPDRAVPVDREASAAGEAGDARGHRPSEAG
ncbi:MDR family MFS transporter [Intrasporangium sp.]|uniref:MDR family MFS transporter n=1 Tax=Intrasporangium sp. TaxID=1925024 RepID=UPI003221838E